MLKVKSRSSCKDKHKVAETHKTKIHKTQSSDANVTKEEKKEKKKSQTIPLKKKKKKPAAQWRKKDTDRSIWCLFASLFSKEVNCNQVANPMRASNKEVMSDPKRKRMCERTLW